ncbi:hypothetical protein GF319_15295 [Candidatus Bathyarchaeota archaeon]|nr:hypothetical protein [Candidatus Bathyarchaeota archaeon]
MENRNILAEHSFRELKDLLLWFHHQGPFPIIIGGWAVYSYNSYLGSVDIDLIGPSMGGLFDATLEGFERERGYQAVTSGPMYLGTSFRKPVYEENNIVGYIEIDACTYENDPKSFHEDRSKFLPYSLCERRGFLTHLSLGENREAKIPIKSLLFLYKLKALRDRQYDLEEGLGILGAERIAWLRAKIVKDASDLISLLDPNPETSIIEQNLDPIIIKELIDEFGLHFCIKSIEKLPNMILACFQYRNISPETVTKWVLNLLKHIIK